MKNESEDNKSSNNKITRVEDALLPVDFTNPLPSLDNSEVLPFDLMSDYWTPQMAGESKRLYFDCLKTRKVLDQETGETIDLICAYFYQKEGEIVKTISNGSKRLVGIFEDGKIQRGVPLLITYLGKKKNSTNSFQSDVWSVKPLLIQLQVPADNKSEEQKDKAK